MSTLKYASRGCYTCPTDLAGSEEHKVLVQKEIGSFLRLGHRTITEADLLCLEKRVRDVLLGASPTRTFRVECKRAAAESNEWAKLFAFQDYLKEEENHARKEHEAQQREGVQKQLKQQIQEQKDRQDRAAAEETAASKRADENFSIWKADESTKEALRKQAMLKLKASVEGQLAERVAQKKLEKSLKLQQEQGSLHDMNAELDAKMKAEAKEAAEAYENYQQLLLANEANKQLKEKQRQEDQALDRKYAREYAAKLDKDEKARLEQLAKRAEYQAKQAAIAKELPESKRWMDPAIIERSYMAREASEMRKEAERKEKAASLKAALKAQLEQQVAERKAAKEGKKAELAVEEVLLDSKHQREIELENAERAKLLAKKDALRQQLQAQLDEAVARKLRGEPAMTQTEREINADMLRRMQAKELAGSMLAASS